MAVKYIDSYNGSFMDEFMWEKRITSSKYFNKTVRQVCIDLMKETIEMEKQRLNEWKDLSTEKAIESDKKIIQKGKEILKQLA